MAITKKIQDYMIKFLFGNSAVPRGLFESREYFRRYDPIHFDYKNENGEWVAISTNFRYGSIITSAKNKKELDRKIKDAILTSFSIPSSYAKEADIKNTKEQYAIA